MSLSLSLSVYPGKYMSLIYGGDRQVGTAVVNGGKKKVQQRRRERKKKKQ